jgi:hypothetical protein
VRGARGAVEAEVYAEYMIQPRMLKKIVQKMKRVMFAAERASVNRSEGRCEGNILLVLLSLVKRLVQAEDLYFS